METARNYDGKTVQVYQDHDLKELGALFQSAQDIWYQEWVAQGSEDIGTCTGGKGIEIRYLAPRKRNYEWKIVVAAPPVQGNLSASRSAKTAMEFLRNNHVDIMYNDGWVD